MLELTKSAVSEDISRWVVGQEEEEEEQSCGRFKGFH